VANGLMECEKRFYRARAELSLPLGKCYVPRCYYGDRPNEGDLVLLEFCEGRSPDFSSGLSGHDLQQCVEALAEFHSNCFTDNAERCHRPDWLTDGLTVLDRNAALFMAGLTPGVTQLLEEYLVPTMGKERVGELRARYLHAAAVRAALEQATGTGYKGPRTLCHGDMWSGNILLDAATGVVTFVDFQFACFSNPMIDLAMLLCSSATPACWTSDLRQTLDVYRSALARSLAATDRALTWSQSDCEQAFKQTLPFAFFMIAVCTEVWVRGRPRVIERYARLATSLLEVDQP